MEQRWFFVIAALFVAPLVAQLPEAKNLYYESRYEEAKSLLKPLKNDPEGLHLLSKIAMAQSDDEGAAELCRKAVQLRPASAEYHYCVGSAVRSLVQHVSIFKQPGLSKEAREELNRAVELDPNHLQARLSLLDYYLYAPGIAGGSEEKALQQAAEIRKRDGFMGHRAYARIYTRQKKPDLARKEFLGAVGEEPKSARARTALAAYYATEDKNYKAAFDELEVAIRLEPTYMPAWFRRGQVAALSSTNLAAGQTALEKYVAVRPKENEPTLITALYYLGAVFEKQGKKAEARQSYAAALKRDPDSQQIQEAMKRVK
jgi:tetratricopeptide (TPR) repeat protein